MIRLRHAPAVAGFVWAVAAVALQSREIGWGAIILLAVALVLRLADRRSRGG